MAPSPAAGRRKQDGVGFLCAGSGRVPPPQLRGASEPPAKGGGERRRAARVCGFLPTPEPPAHSREDASPSFVPTPRRAGCLPSRGNFSGSRSGGIRGGSPVFETRRTSVRPGARRARCAADACPGAARPPEPREPSARLGPGTRPPSGRDPRGAGPSRCAAPPAGDVPAPPARRAAASAGQARGA